MAELLRILYVSAFFFDFIDRGPTTEGQRGVEGGAEE
jgi:hypothetical protein